MSEHNMAAGGFSENAEKPEWRRTAPFAGEARGFRRSFRRLIGKEGEAASSVLADHGSKIERELAAAIRSLGDYGKLPALSDGRPYLYSCALAYMESCDGTPTQKSLCEFLSFRQTGKSFYNCEMILLRSFLVIAAVALYLEKKDERCLSAVNRLSDIDFEAVYFMFSGVERYFRRRLPAFTFTATSKHAVCIMNGSVCLPPAGKWTSLPPRVKS